IQIAQQFGELDLHKNRYRDAVFPLLYITFRAQARSLDLLVEMGREKIKTAMFELKSFYSFRDSSLSENQARLTAQDRIADNGPLLESRDAPMAVFFNCFLFTRIRFGCKSVHRFCLAHACNVHKSAKGI